MSCRPPSSSSPSTSWVATRASSRTTGRCSPRASSIGAGRCSRAPSRASTTTASTAPAGAPAPAPTARHIVVKYVALALIWGSSFLLIKVALEGLSPAQVALGRIVLGALALAVVATVTRRRWPSDARSWGHLAVTGVLLCCRRAAAVMAPGGAIVNLSSGAATLGGPGEYVHYAASKGAVDTLTIGLSKELGPDGIRVNAVAPGVVRTEIHLDPERPARVGAQTPLGRAGSPDEIAGAVAWLLSADASYTTGAILRVAGGR